MTPEERRRQDELADLIYSKDLLNRCDKIITFLQDEYRMGLEKARGSEPKLEDLTLGQIAKRTIGWEKTEVQKYEEGPGKNLKEQMAHEQQQKDALWKDLQTNYGIPSNDKDALNRTIAERKQSLQPAPMSPEEYHEKQERLENLIAYRDLRRKLTNEIKEAQAKLVDPYRSRSPEEKAELQERIAENQRHIVTLDKVAQKNYQVSPNLSLDPNNPLPSTQNAIAKLEEELRNAAPTQQAAPPPQPQAPTNPEPSEPVQPSPQVAPSTQDTPTQPSGGPAQSPKETKPKASFREFFEQPALGERQTVEDYGRQQQAQREQEFYRQLDQNYTKVETPPQNSIQPQEQQPSPQQPPTQAPLPHQVQPGHFRDLYTIGDQVQDMQRGVEQIKAEMDREQGKSGPWKTPFRQLFEQGPEPPRQEQERDRSR